MRTSIRGVLLHAFLLLQALALASLRPALAQERFTIEDVLSPAFPFDLVSAAGTDRIAWIEFERGMRNVWTASAPDFAPRRLTGYLKDDGHDLSTLRISDDGSVVAFLRGHTPNRDGWIANPTSDPMGAERAVWAAHTSGGEPWRVVEAWSFALSPDGRWVAYEKDGQIWRAPVDPGVAGREGALQEAPLFRAFGRNRGPVWSPDARRIAFVSDRQDHAFVGVYDTEARRVTWLAPAVDRDEAPVWSPDGTRVAFIRRPGLAFGDEAGRRPEGRRTAEPSGLPAGLVGAKFAGGHALSIWVADARTGEGREVWHDAPSDSVWAEMRQLLWADGHLLFQAEPEGWRHTFALALDDPAPRPVLLTPGEGEAEHFALSADRRTLYYATNAGDIDRRHLWKVPAGGGRAVQLTRGDGIETYPAVLASEERVAVLHAAARQPQSVALVSSGGGDARVITPLPQTFPGTRHVDPTNVVVTAEDGFETHNQLFLPPGLRPGEKRPALIFIHGGSRRQMLLGYHYMHFYHMAYAMNQYFANQGYVVLSVNYRSGIGYGRAFRNAPGRGGEGNTEYGDILAAGKYLQGRPDVDPAKVGVWGLSYGGILTAQALARNSDVFAAGVDIAGVHLWGTSLDAESTSYQSSAVSQVESWRSPVLLIHGDDDRNVAFSQTVGLVQALRAHDVPHELIVFPDEVHDFLVFDRWLRTFHATDDFFRRKLVGREPVAVTGSERR